MTKHQQTLKYRSRRSAFTLVELLMALAITAILIAATSVAFDAALKNYQANQQQGLAGLAARNVLQQLCREIRSAKNDPCSPIVISSDGTECSFVDVADEVIVYSYDPDQHQMLVNINNSADWYTFLTDVYPISENEPIFSEYAPANDEFDPAVVGRVAIRFRLERPAASYPVYASVVPRNIVLQN